jgi:threonylcarbamoyladenosine tRNA methylthiotransferase CDKAL1
MQSQFYLETYGCSLNMADSDMIVGRLHHLGFQQVDSANTSDVIILNSCGVKEPTEDKIISRLEVLSNSQVPVVITGCLPRISFKRIANAIPNFGAILGPQALDSLGPIVERVVQGDRGIVHLETDSESKLRYFEGPRDSVICTIPICEGCMGSCAYCAVRFARTSVRSYKISDLLGVVERCVHLGYREIRLTAQDVGAFGHESGEDLIDLLHQLSTIPGSHRFRLGMFNPNLVIDRLDSFIDVLSSERFFRFFHIPLQSGSDTVLEAMNRRYTVSDWKTVVAAFTEYFSEVTVATDIIAGFPGETDEDFEKTLQLLRETRPSVINISKYGDRPGAAASKLPSKVETSTKKQRSRQLSILAGNLAEEANRSWIGWKGPVLVTGNMRHGQLQGRTHTYKSVLLLDDSPLGSLPDVEITDAKKTHLVGTIL